MKYILISISLFASQVAWSFDFNSFNDILRVSKCARSVSGDIETKPAGPSGTVSGLAQGHWH